MKIFFVIPTLKQGGAERVISVLANEFVLKKYKVSIVLLAESKDFYRVDSHINIHRLGFKNNSKIGKIKSEINTFVKFRKLIKKESPNIIISFMTKFNIFTLISTRFLNIPVLVSDRSNPNKKLSLIIDKLRSKTYKYASGIVVQTSLAKDVLSKKIENSNIKVIQNPIKKIEIDLTVKKEKIILNVGRLVKEKGQKYLLEAFAGIDDKDWELHIAGDGPLKEELQIISEKLNLGKRVRFLGEVSDIDSLLIKSSIFVFSSISEGFPNALIEAMGAGLPVISFDCDAGPRDIIKNEENGILIDVYDIQNLRKKINELIKDDKKREYLGGNAVYVNRLFDISRIADRWIDLINSVLAGEEI